MDKIYCDYKMCDNHPGDGECDMVGVFIDEKGMCGAMFPAIPHQLITKHKKFTPPRYDEVYYKGQQELLDNN